MKYAVSAALLVLLVTGCGGNGKSEAVDAPSSAASRTDGGAPGSDVSKAPEQDGNPVDSAAFCAFLKDVEPDVKSVGSKVGAQAQLTIALAEWAEKHPDQQPRSAADLDDAAQRGCRALRASLVAATGHSSFEEALG
ncbi:hypothetical protein ACIP98_13290 [Streptomyces sp. NPDC088354]|uniref:hypothetical protein n=1 Tax=unclassified Streptomyces TaxID=2593676 RepID=UPI0029B91E4E|nr:hypothetical protein [Streptomyces sp. MI02-7b]MDX3071174.1 hypothetical protein [Streptomyces sp. MI02-7b]